MDIGLTTNLITRSQAELSSQSGSFRLFSSNKWVAKTKLIRKKTETKNEVNIALSRRQRVIKMLWRSRIICRYTPAVSDPIWLSVSMLLSMFVFFFRWISSLCQHPPGVRQALHHLPGASEVPSHPGGDARRAGVGQPDRLSRQTGRQRLRQKRWLTARETVNTPRLHWEMEHCIQYTLKEDT